MGKLSDVWNKVVGTVGGVNDDDYETDEYDDDELEDEVEEQHDAPRRAVAPARRSAVGSPQLDRPMKMMIVEPETFDDSQSIADYLRERKPVVINFESTAPDISKRVVDFVSGATYSLDGNIQKVGTDIFLCVPSNITVDRSKHDYSNFSASTLSWNAGGTTNNTNGGNTPQQ